MSLKYNDAAEQIMIMQEALRKNKHIHFAINAVSYKTGKKWHKSKVELAELKGRIQNIWDCLNNGIPPLCIDKRTNGICFFEGW